MKLPPLALGLPPTEIASGGSPLAREAARKERTSAHGPTAAERKAAQEFEAIFLRKMLASMEKSSKVEGSGSLSSSANAYSSMIVGALADAVAAAGGMGLGQAVLDSIAVSKVEPSKAEIPETNPRGSPAHAEGTHISDSPVQGSRPLTVQERWKGNE